MSSIKCKAKTSSGKKCTRTALDKFSFCKLHLSKNKADKQKEKYYQVIDLVFGVCKTKKWFASLEAQDKNFQFATIQVWKEVGLNTIEAVINITMSNGVKYGIEKTSFHNYGITNLFDAISLKIRELDWLENKKDKKKPEKTEKSSDSSIILDKILRNFDRVARQLKRRYNNRESFEIKDEYDAQDLLHAVLRAYFDDVRPEEHTPSYAGSSSRVDFLLKQEKIVVEIKCSTSKLKEKEIGEQLIIDIKKYQAHPDCKSLYCLVYDPEGNIRNPIGFENDLSGKDNNINVLVLVVPN